MSSATNLDAVRSIYAAWERGDYGSNEWADPEIEVVIVDGPDPSSWWGLTAMAERWREVLSAWEGYRSAAEEFREIDSDHVFVLAHISGRGKTSGLETEQGAANLFTLRSGKVTRLVIYWDRDRAFADLALTPDTGT
jgi:ketosteroid isomerase-like protein